MKRNSAPSAGRLVLKPVAAAVATLIASGYTAVPAFAASGCCDVSVDGSAHWRADGLNYIDLELDLANGCNTAVNGLTVTLTICSLEDITYAGEDKLPQGWTQLGKGNKKLTADGSGCYTVTYTSGQTLAGNGTVHPQFTVKTQAYVGSGNSRPAGTVTAVVSTSGCTSPPKIVTIPGVG